MKNKYTNNTNISLSMAVFLATDNYDHDPDPNHLSVTTLIKSPKQIILSDRVKNTMEITTDLSDLILSQSGTAIHTAVEQAWLTNHKKAMKKLGYPDYIIEHTLVNPTKKELKEHRDTGFEVFPVYLEKRSEKIVKGRRISGKFDIVIQGALEDIKETNVWTYIFNSNKKAYTLQGSIYRWLNQDIITEDYLTIQYKFTNWSANDLARNPGQYPPHRMMGVKYPLMTIQQTENYINNKVQLLNELWDQPEEQIPDCTPEELWQTPSVFKYFKNPNNTKRSTKNYDTMGEAQARLIQDGNIGKIIEVPGVAKHCNYCKAAPLCKQREKYI